MSRYAQLSDCDDPVVVVLESDLDKADQYIDATLRQRGVQPDEVSVPNDLLRNLAVYRALVIAAVRGSIGADSTLSAKADEYRKMLKDLERQVSRASLQMELDGERPGGGLVSVPLERG